VLNIQALELDPTDQLGATVLHQLQRVVTERDTYAGVSCDILEIALHLNCVSEVIPEYNVFIKHQ
jgi:hypothetical protein